jgi:hypothetical protein
MKTKPTRFFLAAAARLRMLRNELVAWLEVLLVARRNPKRSFEVKKECPKSVHDGMAI